ncbi:MAG: molybdopterin-binding protein [Dehalococcoidales bacterium]
MLKKVRTRDAVGMVIAHDMTKIIPGEYKGARFKRGHVIAETDIDELLGMGKEHIYVDDGANEKIVHEEEAAVRLAAAISGQNTKPAIVKEGRLNIKSTIDGLVKVNRELIASINSVDSITVATLHNNTPVKAGSIVAGTKVTPLYIEEEKIKQAEHLAASKGKAVYVKPYLVKKVGVVVTGNEVYNGLIQDRFVGIMRSKLLEMGADIFASMIVPDDEEKIAQAIIEMKNQGAELIATCGGLAVDPDDVTLEGIKRSGASIIKYGLPIMPGAMGLLAILGETPILGAPAGGLFHTTAIDVVLPRLIAGEIITTEEAVEYGYGGLCLNCEHCQYPVCPFCR